MVEAVLERVPAVVERVQREITVARFIGKLAVDQGVRELRSRVESLTAADTGAAGAGAGSGVETPSDTTSPNPVGAPDRPDVASLALADYDELPAASIVAKLAALEPDERSAIAEYERAHRNRRTVLGKIAQLDDERATT